MQHLISVILALLFLGDSLLGQGVPVLQTGNLEVSAFGAFNSGSGLGILQRTLDDTTDIVTPSSNGSIGADFNWAPLARMRIYAEASYIAGGGIRFNQDFFVQSEFPTSQRRTIIADTSALDLQAGVHFLFPMKAKPEFIPYVVAGLGVIEFRGGLSNAAIGVPVEPPAQTSSISISSRKIVPSVGAGGRYYFTERTGLRFEFKGYLRAGSQSGTEIFQSGGRFGRFLFGMFYQFR